MGRNDEAMTFCFQKVKGQLHCFLQPDFFVEAEKPQGVILVLSKQAGSDLIDSWVMSFDWKACRVLF